MYGGAGVRDVLFLCRVTGSWPGLDSPVSWGRQLTGLQSTPTSEVTAAFTQASPLTTLFVQVESVSNLLYGNIHKDKNFMQNYPLTFQKKYGISYIILIFT